MKTFVFACLSLLSLSSFAQTVWNSGSLTINNTPGNSDCITANVCLSRDTYYPLYNSVTQTGGDVAYDCNANPADTEWAFGTINNWNTLTYQNLLTEVGGCYAATSITNGPLVCHLITDDIYVEITFTYWQAFGGGGFNYTRTDAVLPIDLPAFHADQEEGTVLLEWLTDLEVNNEKFNIQRSADNLEWETIGEVAGAGSSTDQQDYRFRDYLPAIGTNYYRLQQVDFDGKVDVSKVLHVEVESAPGHINLFPNPADQQVEVALLTDYSGPARLELHDIQGRLVHVEQVDLQQGSAPLLMDVSAVPPGMYLLNLVAGQSFWQKSLVIR